jgi:hypothetical protein
VPVENSLNRSRSFFYRKLVIAAITLFLLLQLPFLQADPHQVRYFGRDAFTDEALGLNQVINWVEDGSLNMKEGDNLIKNPLFNFHQVPFLLLKNSRAASRIGVMLILLLLLFIISRSSNDFSFFIPFFLFLGLLHYDSFQYFHFSMPEGICAFLILLGLAFVHRWIIDARNRTFKSLLLLHLPFVLCYWEKNQYFFAAVIPTLVFFILWISKLDKRRHFLQSVVINAGFLFLYILLWYLPNRESFNMIMGAMLDSRFAAPEIFFAELNENLKRAFFSSHELPFTVFFLLALLAGPFLFQKERLRYKVGYLLILLWFFLELHKLGIRWVPTRYLISFYMMMGAMIAWVAMEAYLRFFRRKGNKIWVFYSIAVSLLVFFHGRNLIVLWEQRSSNITEIRNDISPRLHNGRYAIGSWAPSLTWGSKVRTIPVWKDYLNDTDIINLYHPQLIITEEDEGDVNGLFRDRGIDLKGEADSVEYRQVGKWKLVLYWFK